MENQIIHFQEIKKAAEHASHGLKPALLLEPSTGYTYLIPENDYRWCYTDEDTIIHVKDRDLFYLTDEIASWVSSREECAVLICRETTEKALIPSQLLLGRINSWPEGTLNDLRVSRVHGKITCEGNDYILTVSPVPTKNGTFLNHEMLSPGQTVALKAGDVIRVGRFHLEFSRIPLVKRSLEEIDFDE